MNQLEDEQAQEAIDRLIKKQNLDMLAWHKAKSGTNFTRPEQISVTLLVDGGKVRIWLRHFIAFSGRFLTYSLEKFASFAKVCAHGRTPPYAKPRFFRQ